MYRALRVSLYISIFMGAFVFLCEVYTLSEYGDSLVLTLRDLLILPVLMLCLLALPILLVMHAFPKARLVGRKGTIFVLVLIVTLVASIRLSGAYRLSEFGKLAERSASLISAIKKYEQDFNRPPEKLEDLLPNYIGEIPTTGMRAYPEYVYLINKNVNQYEGNSWVLLVHASTGVLNWDIFLYLPLQNYPEYGYGGVLKRVGDWAYVFE